MAVDLEARVHNALREEPNVAPPELVSRILSGDPSIKGGVDAAANELRSVLRAGGLDISLALQAELDRGKRGGK